MFQGFFKPEGKGLLAFCMIFCAAVCSFAVESAAPIVLHMKNGDRISGRISSETVSNIVITTEWSGKMEIPLTQIGQREIIVNTTNKIAAKTPPGPQAPPPVPPAMPHWKSVVMFGADALWGLHNRQLYYSRLNLKYDRPAAHDPTRHYTTAMDYAVDYGETDGVTSANKMEGGLKATADVGHHLYTYGDSRAGFDEIRKLDLYYENGAGLGVHVLTHPLFKLNLEAGANYQKQERSLGPDQSDFYARSGQDVIWKISQRLTFTERFEFFDNMNDYQQFRFRMDSTLALAVWKNISLNLSLLDIYDTNPARTVNRNELQLRSSIGVTF